MPTWIEWSRRQSSAPPSLDFNSLLLVAHSFKKHALSPDMESSLSLMPRHLTQLVFPAPTPTLLSLEATRGLPHRLLPKLPANHASCPSRQLPRQGGRGKHSHSTSSGFVYTWSSEESKPGCPWLRGQWRKGGERGWEDPNHSSFHT